MREIMFRGKNVENNEWMFGLLDDVDHDADFTAILPRRDERSKFAGCGWEVYPSTVGQYTGLTDKNGKRIFEGDIISTDIARPYLVVEFRDGCFMFNCNDGGEDYYDIMLPILKEAQTVYKYGEVIGNIHDNPELLEEG